MPKASLSRRDSFGAGRMGANDTTLNKFKFLKQLLFILFSYREVVFSNICFIIFNRVDMIQCNQIRAVKPVKLICRQFSFHGFQRKMSGMALTFLPDINIYIITQRMYVNNIIYWDLGKEGIGAYKNVVFLFFINVLLRLFSIKKHLLSL